MKKVKNIYYTETREERSGIYDTGLVIELEDGRFFRAQTTDVIVPFEEFNPLNQ